MEDGLGAATVLREPTALRLPEYGGASAQLARGPSEALMGHCDADDLALTSIITRTYSHPDIQRFMSQQTDFSIATEAYDAALDSLRVALSPPEMAQVQSTMSIQHLHTVALEAQKVNSTGTRAGKVKNFVRIIDRYSGVLDVLSQTHAEYSALAWGTIKWLLIIALSYVDLLARLSVMLDDIGHSLPRLLLYQRLLPTNRMSRIISELYAAIINFLSQSIAFFRRRRIRRYFSFLWGPLEIKFKETMDRIKRTQDCVENDARATAMAQQQMENTLITRRLSELTLVSRHTLQNVLEVKARQTVALLAIIRQSIFPGTEQDFLFQGETMKFYTTFVAPEWQRWYLEEARHVSWYSSSETALKYVQTETLQQVIVAGLLARDPGPSCQLPQSFLFWAPGMTQVSALACLIFQLLEKHAEKLLYRHSPSFYATKFRQGSTSLEALWEIFVDILGALPGHRCCLQIISDSLEAHAFVKRAIEFSHSWSRKQQALVIYHVTDVSLSSTPGTVELDNVYDVDLDLDATEALSRTVLLELGVFNNLSDNMKHSIWATLWRTLRYNLMVLTFQLVKEHDMLVQRTSESLPRSSIDNQNVSLWKERQSLEQLKRKIISFLCSLPVDIPLEIRDRLRASVQDFQRNKSDSEFPRTGTPPYRENWQPEPLTTNQRQVLWSTTKSLLQKTAIHVFRDKILVVIKDKLGGSSWRYDQERVRNTSQALTRDEIERYCEGDNASNYIEEVFTRQAWDTEEFENSQKLLREGLTNAALSGLTQTMGLYSQARALFFTNGPDHGLGEGRQIKALSRYNHGEQCHREE